MQNTIYSVTTAIELRDMEGYVGGMFYAVDTAFWYAWDATSTAVDNGTTILKYTGFTTGRWTQRTNSLGIQAANTVLAGPAGAPPAISSFRSLVNDDLPNAGVAANTYKGSVTVNSKGIVTAATNPTFNNSVARTLSNAAGSTNQYTISTTQNARVTYSIQINFSITALLASGATIYLEYSTNSGSSWSTVSQVTYSLNLGLALSGSNDLNLSGEIPANALVRLRTTTTNATATFIRGQEILY